MHLEDKLTTAAANGNAAHVEELLQAGTQVNGTNRFGRTALQVGVTGCFSASSRTRVRGLIRHRTYGDQLHRRSRGRRGSILGDSCGERKLR